MRSRGLEVKLPVETELVQLVYLREFQRVQEFVRVEQR